MNEDLDSMSRDPMKRPKQESCPALQPRMRDATSRHIDAIFAINADAIPGVNIHFAVHGHTNVAGAWMRRSDPAEDALP